MTHKILISLLFTTLLGIGSNVAFSEQTDPKDHPIKIKLTDKEKLWIFDHPVIYYSDDNDLEPFVFLKNDNELDGISVDYLKLIENITQLKFQFVKSKNWTDVIRQLKNRDIQLVLAAIFTPERTSFASFTTPYFSAPLAVVTNQSYSYINDLNELNGKTIAVPKGFYSKYYLKTNFPEIHQHDVETVGEGLKAVNDGKADAFIGNLGIAIHNIKKSIYPKLKISGTVGESTDIRFMVGKDNPELVSIINKAMAKITTDQKRAIENSWFGIELDQGIDPRTLWEIVAIFITLLGLGLIWVRKLKLEVFARRKTEIRLRRARNKARKASQAKSDFIANMSHEIRTPLNAISGFSQLLEQTKLSDEQEIYVKSIKVGGDVLLHIINDILDISQIEHGIIHLSPEPINIKQIIEEIEAIFSQEFEKKSLYLKVIYEEQINRQIVIDKYKLRQILINLVANALKFTEDGGVTLKVKLEDDDDFLTSSLTIEVIDTGIGIEAERTSKIFDEFVHHENSHTSNFSGTGLGLTICRKFTKVLGGKISVKSQPDKGSTFIFKINNIPHQ